MKGIPTEAVFFGSRTAERLAREGKSADLVIGNNVLTHVPDLNAFVAGLRKILKPNGRSPWSFPTCSAW